MKEFEESMCENAPIRFSRRDDVYYQFSNFYPCSVNYNGLLFSNTEAAWQAQKDPSRAKEFVGLSGGQAKKLGRRVNLRPDWGYVKVQLMHEVLWCKFTQNEDLKQLLISTGDRCLIENTTGWRDGIWGMYATEYGWRGKNLLGKCLMLTRLAINCNCTEPLTLSKDDIERLCREW